MTYCSSFLEMFFDSFRTWIVTPSLCLCAQNSTSATRPAHVARKPNFHIPERRVWVNEGRPKGVPQSGKAKITYSTGVGFTAEYSYESAEPGWLEESNSVAQVFHCPFTCSRQGQVFLFRKFANLTIDIYIVGLVS